LDLLIRLQVYILSFLMLLVLSVQLFSRQDGSLPRRLLKLMILSTMFVTSMEALSWAFDGRPGQASRIIGILTNGLLLACNGVPLLAWTLYLDLRVYRDLGRVRRQAILLFCIGAVHAVLALSSPLNGFYFYLDSNNYYHRGSLAPIVILIFIAFLVYDALLLIRNWNKLEQREVIPLLLSLLPPIIGFYLQVKYYGLGLVWAGVSLSVLIVYTVTQNQIITTDYLTGLYNRRHLDYYLETALKNPQRRRQLAGIMLDIDDFKQINDIHGHLVGDRAIEATARALTRYFRGAFVARYAGDEFVVLLALSNAEQLDALVNGFHRQLESDRQFTDAPRGLRVSTGASVYPADTLLSADQFLMQLDRLMYQHKVAKKAGVNSISQAQASAQDS